MSSEFKSFLESSSLFIKESGTDEIYNFNRNCEHRLDILKYCERMWQQFEPYSGDENFIREFRDKFRQKWWELFLADSFSRNNFELQKSNSEGPDICLKESDSKVWVEAISMTNGEEGTPGRVPDVIYGQAQMVPTDKVLLRLTSGFKEKSDKFLKYLENGVVGPNDRLIIAIDLSGVSHAIVAEDEQMPLLCKALLGIGELTMSIPVVKGDGEIKSFYPKREHIEKAQGILIPATALLMDGFNHISGVITNVKSFTETEANPHCLRLVCNPKAKNRLNHEPCKWLRNVFYEEDGYLRRWPIAETTE